MPKLSDVARHVVTPVGITSTGWPAIEETCRVMGIGFDEWQRGLGKVILAKRGDGLFAADIMLMSIPRQSGKTYLLSGVVFAMCVQQRTTVIWTAHRTRTAAETFRSMQGTASRDLVAPHVKTIVRGAGNEAVEFVNGSRILFGARERGFGRGFAGVDVLIFDEAQILSESAMDDMVPATNAAPNPLVLMAGTPPRPTDPGEVFTLLRQEALDGESTDVGFVEISAERGADPLDKATWPHMNPSYPKRTSERAILRMFKVLTPDSFRREAQGIWDEYTRHQPVIKAAHWAELVDVGPRFDVAPDALAVDMAHDRRISVAGCWVEGEAAHIEEVWAGDDATMVVDWVTSHAARRPVLIDTMSPASSLFPDLKARRLNVKQTSAADMVKACGLFESKAKDGTLTHADQPSVNAALEDARKRAIRDSGGWGWDRKDPSVSIHPIVAATLALLGATSNQRHATTLKRREAIVL